MGRRGPGPDAGSLTGLAPLIAEAYRLRLMRGLEQQFATAGYGLVAGIDEAGRGCLAGPVVAAAVVVAPDCLIPGIDDSKRLSAPRREQLAAAIRQRVAAWSVARGDAALIDRINILEATRWAMRSALRSLSVRPAVALVDAVRFDAVDVCGEEVPLVPLVRADSLSFAVACASIIAKTDRDRLMAAYDRQYPGFGFASHKGYASEEHRAALKELGPTPLHRLTFRSVLPT